MKLKTLLTKTLLAAGLLCVGVNASWADEVVPTPVYFNDFSFAVSGSDNIKIEGSGEFITDADAHFGQIYHNDPNLTKAIRTNFLKLPSDVLSHSASTKEMTIGFWVNVKKAADYYWTPIFSAYDKAPYSGKLANDADGLVNDWTMFTCESRGLLQYNLNAYEGGWCDFTAVQNDKGANAESTDWLNDKAWHYYTVTLTTTKAIVYVDGAVVNSWTISDASAFFEKVGNLTYVCLGGNQTANFADLDPAYGFDDFAVYDKALTKAQIDQIRNNKNRSVTGTKIGAIDNSTDYLVATSSQITLNPGDSYHYNFINYNGGGKNNWNNWTLPVYNTSGDRVITVRADNWEDLHNVGDAWGSNLGCTSNFNWDFFTGELNGATVDMTVTFTKDKVFNMASTITTVGGSTWNYSYTNDYAESPISLTANDHIKVALSVSRSWIDLLSEGYSAVAASLGANGYATFAAPYALNLASLPDGLTAYKAETINGTNVHFTEVTEAVKANTGLLLAGAENGTYSIPVVASGADISGTNLLLVNETGAIFDAVSGHKYYAMVKNSDPLKFGWFDPATLAFPSTKAYLDVVSGPGAHLNVIFGEEETTGIETVNNVQCSMFNGQCFDLQGRRVAAPQKGLYIVNGKKVVIK